jgi:hypothetical protein
LEKGNYSLPGGNSRETKGNKRFAKRNSVQAKRSCAWAKANAWLAAENFMPAKGWKEVREAKAGLTRSDSQTRDRISFVRQEMIGEGSEGRVPSIG